MASASTSAVGRKPKYQYLTLKEAFELLTQKYSTNETGCVKANIYAIVIEYSSIRETRGTDKMCLLKLFDNTVADIGYPEGVEMLCFASNPEKLPIPNSLGDIIRMHRVEINFWKEKMQLVAKIKPNFPFHYTIFPFEGEIKAYMSSSNNFTFEDNDITQVKKLRSLHCAELCSVPRDEQKSFVRRICDITPKDVSFDLLCKVLYVERAGNALEYLVWDGTDTKPLLINEDTTSVVAQELSLQQDFEIERSQLKLEVLKAFKLDTLEANYGTIFPIHVVSSGQADTQQITAGSWIKFRHLRCAVVAGQIQALYSNESRWGKHIPNDILLNDLRTRIANSQIAMWAPCNRSNFRTRTTHSRHRVSSIRQIRMDAQKGLPNKYRVHARILGYFPSSFENFCKIRKCKDGTKKGVLTLRLRIEDGTGDLDVILWDETAEQFLGVKAEDLDTKNHNYEALAQHIDNLMGFHTSEESNDEVVWADLCIFSYFKDKEDPWNTCNYRVFDTYYKE